MGPDNLVNVKTFLSHGDKKKKEKDFGSSSI
jgi:hypothetical protein